MIQNYLDECYAEIEKVSQRSNIKRWKNETVKELKNFVRFYKPWIWMPGVYATTPSKKIIFLADLWFKQNVGLRSAILVHEWIHIRQIVEGRTSVWKYLTSKENRKQNEVEGYKEQNLFLFYWNKYYS